MNTSECGGLCAAGYYCPSYLRPEMFPLAPSHTVWPGKPHTSAAGSNAAATAAAAAAAAATAAALVVVVIVIVVAWVFYLVCACCGCTFVNNVYQALQATSLAHPPAITMAII